MMIYFAPRVTEDLMGIFPVSEALSARVYNEICGGCRYTAYESAGGWLAADTTCPFGAATLE
jgi:hypothetical protein